VHTGFWWGNLTEELHLEDPNRKWEDNIKIDRREMGWGHGLDQSGSEQEHVTGFCECSNEPSGPIKCGEFLD
jgi:hypothetical protein